MLKRAVTLSAVLVLFAGCGASSTAVAVVDGVEIGGDVLDSLSPGDDSTPEDVARDLNLLILYDILTRREQSEFDFVPTEAQIDEAFAERVRGKTEGVDEWLAGRGSTSERALLESELDVIRAELQDVMVMTDGYGFDFDAAYRSFLGRNSRVCLSVLVITDPGVTDDVETAAEDGASLDGLVSAFGDGVEILDVGCDLPIQLGPVLSPVAVDGEVGVAYLREGEDGSTFFVEVTERDAPSADDVRDEVMAVGRELQGPGLFDSWVLLALSEADVEVNEQVGVWSTAGDGSDVPSVIPPG
jgi:hypothetical protein